MNKYICLSLTLFAIIAFSSCEKVIEDFEDVNNDFQTDTLIIDSYASIDSRNEEIVYEGLGSIIGKNETVTQNGSTISSWFGCTIVVGYNFGYNPSDDLFTFEEDGKIAYIISMSDDSDPIDTSLSLELNTTYPADILYVNAESIEEFEMMDTNDSYPGVGMQSVSLTITEINEISYGGHFEGSYIDTQTMESVPITGEFNVNIVQ